MQKRTVMVNSFCSTSKGLFIGSELKKTSNMAYFLEKQYKSRYLAGKLGKFLKAELHQSTEGLLSACADLLRLCSTLNRPAYASENTEATKIKTTKTKNLLISIFGN